MKKFITIALLSLALVGVLLLLSGSGLGQQKPYAGFTAYITSTFVNQNKVLIIEAASVRPSAVLFTFDCNADDSSCHAPALHAACSVSVPQEPHYSAPG